MEEEYTGTNLILAHHKIKQCDKLMFIMDAAENILTLERNLCQRVHDLYLFFHEVETRDEEVRNNIESLSPGIDFLLRNIEVVRDLNEERTPKRGIVKDVEIILHAIGSREVGPRVIYGYASILQHLYTQWSNTARLIWKFYEAPIPDDREMKLQSVLSVLRHEESLTPFLMQAGIDFNKHGETYIKEDSSLRAFIPYRNRTSHKITGVLSTIGLVLSPNADVDVYYDHYDKKFKSVPIIPPEMWREIAEQSYVHFVDCYNTLLGIFEQVVEKRGRI